jgi:hypothetical protein
MDCVFLISFRRNGQSWHKILFHGDHVGSTWAPGTLPRSSAKPAAVMAPRNCMANCSRVYEPSLCAKVTMLRHMITRDSRQKYGPCLLCTLGSNNFPLCTYLVQCKVGGREKILCSTEQKGIMKQLWPSRILDQGTGFTLELFFPG